ncbi:MAG: hypothetical protein PUF79_06080, partial [Lactobacillaceae bacterium]|nr:hypothetical protein [Lactobacillaceae bacterium]
RILHIFVKLIHGESLRFDCVKRFNHTGKAFPFSIQVSEFTQNILRSHSHPVLMNCFVAAPAKFNSNGIIQEIIPNSAYFFLKMKRQSVQLKSY